VSVYAGCGAPPAPADREVARFTLRGVCRRAWSEGAGFLIGRRYEIPVSAGRLVLRTV